MGLNFKTFPADVKLKNEDQKSIAAEIYGNRFHADQTLYEYLIEFLLIFVSESDNEDNPKQKLQFHNPYATGNLSYTVEPRMGLKRFIFFDKSKKNDAVEVDKSAYMELLEALKEKIKDCDEDTKVEVLESLQDLLHGYAVVLRKRSWCAQAMLPLCPELIFCEAMPMNKERKKIKWDDKDKIVDTKFIFNKRSFLARGGELYYLHILQGLQGNAIKKEQLERLFRDLLVKDGKKMTRIADFIQDTWEEYMGYKDHPKQKLGISFIPEAAYKNIASDSVDELINYMSCRMHPVKKIELLAKGVMIQVMRMLSVATTNYLRWDRECWIIDMNGAFGGVMKKIAANSFSNVQGMYTTALGQSITVSEGSERLKLISKARKDSFDIFKAKGKELQFIIPTSGPYERFSLPEDCIRFFVLALLEPGKKMTLDSFLKKLYDNYRIVVGPAEYKRMNHMNNKEGSSLANSLSENVMAFQKFLKATGFLRELSDSTSIVVNPCEDMKGEW